jgi:hypothetical protein
MEKDEFCYNMGQELSTWKNRISEELKKIERMDTGAKQGMLSIVEDFLMLEAEMGSRIEQFKYECSADFVPPVEGSDYMPDFKLSSKEAEEKIGGGNFGG